MNIRDIPKYSQVKFTLKQLPDIVYSGTFRGIIINKDVCAYDNNGKGFWVTINNGFELMADIDDISSITVSLYFCEFCGKWYQKSKMYSDTMCQGCKDEELYYEPCYD